MADCGKNLAICTPKMAEEILDVLCMKEKAIFSNLGTSEAIWRNEKNL